MDIGIKILGLCAVPTLISMLIQTYKRRYSSYQFGKFVLFYLLIYSGIMSFIKILTDEGTRRLVESFDEILPMTFVHYGLPYVVISLVIPFVLRGMFREKLLEWIEKVLSIVLVEILFVYLVTSKISNIWYVICIGVAVILAIVMLCMGTQSTYCSKADWKKQGIPYLLAILMYIVTVVLYMPNEMVITNQDEFLFSFWQHFNITVTGSILLFGLFGILGIYALSKVQIIWCTFFVFSWSVMGYLQAMFLNGKLQAMDGVEQKWSGISIGINLLIWGGVIGTLYALMKKKNTIWLALVKYVSIYICLIQIVSLVTLMITTDLSAGEKGITRKGWTELHEENNIVVFVLDWFDNQILESALQEEPQLLTAMKDFTYYPNATSKYAFTQVAVPYLLTGVEWEKGMDEDVYVENAFAEGTFLNTLLDNSYDIKIYTEEKNMTEDAMKNIGNYDVKTIECQYGKTIEMTSNAAKYKMVPFVLKPYYSYATSDFTGVLGYNNAFTFSEWSTIELYEEVVQNGLKINEMQSEGSFMFFHFWGAHGPYIITRDLQYKETTIEDCAIASMKLVSAYIEEMKRSNVYDKATIIITADHGNNYLSSIREVGDRMGLKELSSPILFVKEANQTNENEMTINHAPVSQEEFHATVLKSAGIDYVRYGKAFDEVAENEQRERVMEFFRYDDIPYVRYVIDGNVADENAWHIEDSEEKK